ncbi:unnamed protein product [Brassica oleracea]
MKKDGSPDKPPTEQTHEEGSTRNSHHGQGSQSKSIFHNLKQPNESRTHKKRPQMPIYRRNQTYESEGGKEGNR